MFDAVQKHPTRHNLLRLAEDARLGLEAFDGAAAGIAAAMRTQTLDPDAACQMLQLVNQAMKARLDTLVDALTAEAGG